MNYLRYSIIFLFIFLNSCICSQKIKFAEDSAQDRENLIQNIEGILIGQGIVFQIDIEQSTDFEITDVYLLVQNYNCKKDSLKLAPENRAVKGNKKIEIIISQLFDSIDELVYSINYSEFTVEIEYKASASDSIISASKNYRIKNKEKILKKLEKIQLIAPSA